MELSQSFRKKLSNLTQFFQEMESDVATMQNDMKNDMSSSRRSPYESSVSAAGAPGNSMEGRRFDNMEEPLASDEVDQAFNSTDMPRRRSGSGSFPKEAAGKRKSGTQPGKNRNGGQSPTSVELPESQKPQVEDEKKNDISKVEAKQMLSEILRKKCSGSDLSKENCNKSNSVIEHLDRTSTQEAHSFSTSNLIGRHSDVQSQVEARKAEPIQSNESNMNIMNEEPADGLLPTRGRHLNEQYRTVLSISTKHPRVGMRTDLKRSEDGTSNVFVSSSTLHLKRNIKVAEKEADKCGENGAGTSKAAEPQFTELDGLPPCSEITTYDKTSSLSEPRSITYATYQSPRKKNRRRKSLEKKNIASQLESGRIDSEDKQVSSPNVDRSQNDHSKLRFPSPESPMLSPKGPAKEVVIEKTELITIEENIVKKGSRNMLEEKWGRSEASSQISKVKETETKSVRNESKIDPTINNYSDQKTPDKQIQETDGIRGFEVDASAKTLTEQSPSSTKALQTKGLSKKLSDLSNRRSRWTVDSANSNISNRVKLQKTTDVQEEQQQGPEEQQLGTEQWQPGSEKQKPEPEQQKLGPQQWKPSTEQWKPDPDQQSSLQEKQPGQEERQPCPEEWKPGPEQRKPGPEQRQPGPEQRQPGPEQQKPGPEQQKPGPEQRQPELEQWKQGPEEQQLSLAKWKLSPDQQPCLQEWQPGPEKCQPDLEKQQPGSEEQQPGLEERQLGLEERQPGPEQRQPGPEQRQPGPEQWQPGLEQQKPGLEQWKPELEQWEQGPGERQPGPEEQQPSLEKWNPSPDWQPSLQELQPSLQERQPGPEESQLDQEEQQPGLEERELGLEERQPGTQEWQPGPEQRQPGPEQRQPGPEQWKPGSEERQPGPEEHQPSPEQRKPSPDWQHRLQEWQPGSEEWQPGPKGPQPNMEEWQAGPEEHHPGPEECQPGPEDWQPGLEQQKPGPEQWNLGPELQPNLEEQKPSIEEQLPGPEEQLPSSKEWQACSKEGQAGPEERQAGLEERKPGPEQRNLGPELQPDPEEKMPSMEEQLPGPEVQLPGPKERQACPEEWQAGPEQQKPGPEQQKPGPEQQKPGPEQQKPGPEERQPGQEQLKPGPEQLKPGPEECQPGPEERRPGLEQRKPGPEQQKPGPEERQPDPVEWQPGQEQQKPGPEEQQPGPEEWQPGQEQLKPCPEQLQLGPEERQPGLEQRKPSPEQQKSGPEERQPDPVEWQPGLEQRKPGPVQLKPGPEQQKPGPEQQKPGPEERQPGQEQLKPGPEQLKPGPEECQPGPEERRPGLEQRKPGPEQQKPGPEERQPDPVEWQPGQEQQKPGPEEQQPGPEEWQPGQEQLKPCPEQLQLGPEERQPGLEQRKPSPEQQKSGPEERQPDPVEWQPGLEQRKPDPVQLKPGPEERQPGPEERQPGPEERQPGPEERQPGLEQRKPGLEQQKPGPEVRQPDPVEWQPDLEQRKPSPEQQKPGPEERQPDPVEWQSSQEQLKPGLEEHQPGPKERQPYQEGQEPGQKGWLPGPEEQQPGPEEQQPDLAERQPDRPKPFYSTTEFQHDPRSLPDLQDAQYDTNKMHHGLEGSFIATNLSYSSNRRETHEDNDIGIAFTVEHPKPTEPIDSDIVNSIVESQINDSPTADAFTETAKECFDPDGNVKGKMTKVLKTGEKSDFKDSSGVKDIDLGQPAVDIMTQNTIVMEPKNPPQINGDVAVESTLDINDSPVPSEKSILPCSGPKQSQVELMEESFTFEPDSQLSPENTILKTATRIFREAQDMENRSTHSPENLTEDLLKENGDLDQSMLPKKILAEHNDLPYFSMESKDVPRQGNDLQLPSEHKMTEPLHSNLHYNVTQKKICNGTSTDVTGQSIHTFTTETMTDEEGHHTSNKMHKGMTVNPKTFLSVKSGEDLNNTASNNGQLNATTEVSSETLQHNGSNFIFDSMEVLNTVNHPHPAVAIEEEEPGVCGGVEIVQMENDDSTLVLYTPQDYDDIYSISLDKLPTIREDVYFEEIEEGEEVYKVEEVEEEEQEEEEEGIAPGTKKQKYFPDTDVYEMFKEIKIPDYSEYFTPNKKDVPKTSKQRMQLGKIRPGLELQKSKPVNQFIPRNLTPSGVSSILNSVKDSSGNQQQFHEEEEGASTSTEEELHNSKVAIQGSQRSQISMYAKTRTGGIDSTREAKIEVKPGVEKQSVVQNKRLSNTLIHSDDSQGLRKQPLDIPEEENSEHQAHLHLIKETVISYPDQSQEHFDDEEREWDGSRNKNKKEAKTVSEVEKPLVPGTRNYMLMRGGNEIRDADGKMSLQKSRGLGVKPTEEVQPENRDKKQSDHKISPVRQDLQIQDKKVNPRPGKVVVFSEPDFAGKQIQVFSSVPDATSWNLSNTISLQVIRGGWLVFKEPNYEGETFSLEEGECEEFCPWQKMEDQKDDHDEDGKHPIGSMKLIVNDNSLPVITLYAHPKCCGNPMVHHEEVECLELYNIRPMVTSITVQSGVWVLHHDYGFNDVIGVLEPGVYPTLESWGAVEPVLGSFYPLCMVVLYEEEEFCGRSQEMCVAITELTGFLQEAGPDVPQSVGSLRVLAGLWVVYEEPGFQGRQLLLEEGEFPRPSAWGDYSGRLGSLRPICCDFGSPQLLLLEDPELEHGKELQLVAEPVADLQLFGFGTHISEFEVQQGVWVAYEEANFCGEQYILERGLYRSHLDWGGSEPSIGSVRPVFLHRTSEPTSESRVVLYSQKNFLGARLEVTESLKVLPDAWLGGAIASIRVLAGCWVLYSAVEFSGLEFVLEEGSYPCRDDFACPNDSQLASLHALPHNVSEPCLSMFSRPGLAGRELEVMSSCRSLTDLGHDGRVSSVCVHSGIWAVFEFPNFRGHQVVLESCEVPNWKERTGWSSVGSLYPLKRCQLYIRLWNSGRSGALAVAKDPLNNENLCVCLLTDEADPAQNWLYRDGILRNLECELCLEVVQEATMMPNSQLQLSGESCHTKQKWTIQPDGVISSVLDPDLLLDVKDAYYYDRNIPVVLNQRAAFRTTQKWDLQFL